FIRGISYRFQLNGAAVDEEQFGTGHSGQEDLRILLEFDLFEMSNQPFHMRCRHAVERATTLELTLYFLGIFQDVPPRTLFLGQPHDFSGSHSTTTVAAPGSSGTLRLRISRSSSKQVKGRCSFIST